MKTGAAALKRPQVSGSQTIINTLETARSQVEKRFLDGGEVLLSVMDVLGQLLGSLDRVTKALDADGASDTSADIAQTVTTLSTLPQQEAARQANYAALSEFGSKLRVHVSDMQETMRYLRTFAVTVKITGAGIAEFAGFAQEILERIHSGTDEVNSFASQLDALSRNLATAMSFGATTSRAYDESVPAVVKALQQDARTIADHRKQLATIAGQVSAIARGIQTKVAATLSALQIGDITRQRIEHVQSAFRFMDELLGTEEGRALDGAARARLENVIHHLTAAQMREMVADFQRESRSVVQTIASFGGDTQEILKLRDEMGEEAGDAGGNFMHALEQSVSAAHHIVKQIEGAREKADDISRSTLATAGNLLRSIEQIRAVKSDINYMALNTNLRCSRMGEEGKSINVVTAELRIFAARLDESADALVTGLENLEQAAGRMTSAQDENSVRLDERLISAVDNIRAGAGLMDGELAVLAEQGREVATKVSLSISRLDFQHDLGELLASCADTLTDLAGDEIADATDLEDVLAPLGARIFKVYTMQQERVVHQAIIPMAEAVTAAPEPQSKSDDDLFEDALF